MPAPREHDSFATNPTIFLRLNSADPQPREIAWDEFRRRYAPIIAGFARNLGAREDDVDDLIQDVMLGFFSQSPTFVYDSAKGRFRGYLKVCTFRALRKRLGGRLMLKTVALRDVDPESLDVDQAWNDVWAQELLRRILDQTREEYRDGNTFRAFEQYVILSRPAEEVAAELGIHLNSVYRAKDQITEVLREKMQALEQEEG